MIGLVCLGLIGCSNEDDGSMNRVSNNVGELNTDRMELVERASFRGYYLYIIKVDSTEYLVSSEGGIEKLK